ncbi:hypothetical protein CISIN_1g007514mg [Citrus sinensis]|uniref:Growth-regulating factor n=1 Tax=Citrus sinensis TaxID=2711 RepID=A0A067GGN0_CITSI|nr:hypothetical protein CISIN_1g007514mg [Citrus sinensis]
MDFGVLGLEGLSGLENGAPSQLSIYPETMPKAVGSSSRFVKKERSEPDEGDKPVSKMPKTVDFSATKTLTLHQPTPLLRSNSLVSPDNNNTRNQHHEQMLSFSSYKSQVPFLTTSTALMERSSQQATAFPFYQHLPSSAHTRNTGYGYGSLNASMHGSFSGARGPFTPSQRIELEHQALIYKYILSNAPVPSNLLIPLKKSLHPFGLPYPASYASNSYGWGTFHLGYSGNTDPEPGRCRRTDGKKWRCSRDAVTDQKYCERHINRGRHRSRKPVEGQTGHSNSKVVPTTSSVSTSVIANGGAPNSLAISQHELKNLQPVAANPSADALVSRVQDSRSLSMMSSTINLKPNESTFSFPKQDFPWEESSQSVFGLVSSDSLLNPSQRSSYLNSKSYDESFLAFNDQETQDQNPLRQFIDDWPKDESNRSVITWPEELKSDWTQLSMSIPMAPPEFSSASSSPTHERLALSPLKLSRELDPMHAGLGMNGGLGEPNQKQTNWIPISWGSSMGGPLGEALANTSKNVNACKNSALNLLTEGWDGSPQLGSSPTGVLQKSTFCSLSNSSSGSSPIAENKKAHDGANLCDDVVGSALASSSSIPSL